MNNFKNIEFIIKLKYKCSIMLFKWKMIILLYQYKSKNRWVLLDKFDVHTRLQSTDTDTTPIQPAQWYENWIDAHSK